ncbi:hypothetical protein C8R44DRAFT_437897 [Mycena epipterygia]|nr:hypothetical protein C8R44DRAFT_437897 [Mycena epipterygia]
MKSALGDFQLTMKQFTEKLRPENGVWSKFSKRLKWTMWSKAESKEYLGKFEQFKSLLSSWLLLHLWDMGQQKMDDTERTQIINWFSPINFFLRQADISQARHAGTGGWFLSDPSFQEWKSGSGKTLWCHGIPGAVG